MFCAINFILLLFLFLFFFQFSNTLFHQKTSGLYYKCFTIVICDRNVSGQYYKTRITIVIDNPSLSQCRSQPQLVSSITILSDATIWSVTYDCHYNDCNGFIIQATEACGLYYKHITIISDNSRVFNKFEASLTDDARVLIYDRHMFIVQAAGTVFTTLNFLRNLLMRL